MTEKAYIGKGLIDAEVQDRGRRYGYNEVPEKQVGPVMEILKTHVESGSLAA